MAGSSFNQRSSRIYRSRSSENIEGTRQHLDETGQIFLSFGEGGLLGVSFVDQPVLPLVGHAWFDRSVEAVIRSGKAVIHANHVTFADIKHMGNLHHLLWLELTLVDRLHVAASAVVS